MKIAAVGDLHYDGSDRRTLTSLTQNAREADVLVLCGDLTTHGRTKQIEGVANALGALGIPVVAVFGNHDHDADATDENTRTLERAGVRVLDGDTLEVDDVGFAGVKGFLGGFGPHALGAFGEGEVKSLVQATVDEALKLENALRDLRTRVKVAVLHYAPCAATIRGEKPEVYPYLGSSRLLPPIETLGADAVFHGHAHSGTHRATTPGGVPVFNVSLPLLRSAGRSIFFWSPPESDHDRASGELAAS